MDFFGEPYGNFIKGLLLKHPILLSSNGEQQFIDSEASYKKTHDTINYLKNILRFLTEQCSFSFAQLDELDLEQLNIHERRELTFIHVINTIIAHRMLHNQIKMHPLAIDDCKAFILMAQKPELRNVIKNDMRNFTNNQFNEFFYENIMKDTFDILNSEIKNIDITNFESRYITTLLLKTFNDRL
jgi:hypothetical protein